jgi:hypothetical protein
MADIDVVKKGSRTWLWVVLLLVLALIIWFMMAGTNTQTGLNLQGAEQLRQATVNVVADASL